MPHPLHSRSHMTIEDHLALGRELRRFTKVINADLINKFAKSSRQCKALVKVRQAIGDEVPHGR
jgi:hypothetical protein